MAAAGVDAPHDYGRDAVNGEFSSTSA